MAHDVRLTRIIFRYAYEAGFIDRPVRFGPQFKAPSRKVLRQARQANGERMFELKFCKIRKSPCGLLALYGGSFEPL